MMFVSYMLSTFYALYWQVWDLSSGIHSYVCPFKTTKSMTFSPWSDILLSIICLITIFVSIIFLCHTPLISKSCSDTGSFWVFAHNGQKHSYPFLCLPQCWGRKVVILFPWSETEEEKLEQIFLTYFLSTKTYFLLRFLYLH